MDHIMTMTNRLARWGVGLCALAMVIDPATVPTYAGEQSGVLRVESEIFAAGDEKPLARTLTLSAGRPASLRSVHKVHPRLLAIDLERIQQAEARAAVAEMVDLATFIDHTSAVPISGASVQPDSLQASELKKGPKVLLPLPSG